MFSSLLINLNIFGSGRINSIWDIHLINHTLDRNY